MSRVTILRSAVSACIDALLQVRGHPNPSVLRQRGKRKNRRRNCNRSTKFLVSNQIPSTRKVVFFHIQWLVVGAGRRGNRKGRGIFFIRGQ
ncbi:hypothetical protein ARMGADRAFT_122452 [Armillaria gallica]|uniref:Uncharacterized protein n=1 Tax=Armillaria gallica TaxID=47427 RepID=A0A2H3DDR9_ARMGA|nr:hypothetical protein ARMGADRAFT_122452 [Armillaria gallica]